MVHINTKLLNEKKRLIERLQNPQECRSCPFYINNKCRVYVPMDHKCLILLGAKNERGA